MDSFRLARAAPPPLRIAAVVAASVILSLQGSPESAEVDFQADVLPILTRKCLRCHAGDKPEGNLSLTDRAAVLQGGDSGPAVVPNDAARSLLLARVTAADPDEAMPPEGERLSDAEIATLRAWIDHGAEWKDPEPYPLALAEVVVPPGVGTPLDRLLADYFRTQGIAAPAFVSDEIFARRTALDLVGR
ncbi:MAG: c-type cytochrome domain-containing protein, partial [Planctomycetia bacterium]